MRRYLRKVEALAWLQVAGSYLPEESPILQGLGSVQLGKVIPECEIEEKNDKEGRKIP